MLGLGWSEILVIAVVALIFVGPKDLPVVLRNLGQAFGAMRRMSNEFRREINKIAAIDEVKDISRSITSPIGQTRKDIAREFNQIRDGKVEPTGKIQPKDGQDDVYEAIAEKAGKSPKPAIAAPETTTQPAAAKPRITRSKASGAKTTKATETAKTAEPAEAGGEAVSEAPKPKRTRKAATTTKKPASSKTRAPAKKAAKPAPAETAPEPVDAEAAAPKRVRKPRKAVEPAAEQPILETAETGDPQ